MDARVVALAEEEAHSGARIVLLVALDDYRPMRYGRT